MDGVPAAAAALFDDNQKQLHLTPFFKRQLHYRLMLVLHLEANTFTTQPRFSHNSQIIYISSAQATRRTGTSQRVPCYCCDTRPALPSSVIVHDLTRTTKMMVQIGETKGLL
ncbi:hypothetical protein EGR_04550 [Echinococcus granulosus]|uniref:Uncharacterized protein n=1 Tax=Echinococcus granulosus TaxID=6210 RepID=W6UHJ3_ECHGR|nr:hypothetical protein EGR_04550 [Echinococcus granulosus]EUB60531.1 hypothetical protein EGR_04550 [Echinococcus granulosus]